ncbi:MAG: hypothetical protein GY769_06930 [bacterium]|nr:hypothetical protein [bacterium]
MNGLSMSAARKCLVVFLTLAWLPLAPAGASEIAFSTYLGGSKHDFGHAIAQTPDGGVVIVGTTDSPDFPTFRALQSESPGKRPNKIRDAFVVKLDASGTRIEFATYLGGSAGDTATAVAVDPGGNIYVAGTTDSDDFPTVEGLDVSPAQERGFLTKVSPDGQTVLFSTLLGVSPSALAYERNGRVFVAGGSFSTEFFGLPTNPSDPYALYTAFIASIDTREARLGTFALLGKSGFQQVTHLVWDSKRRTLWAAGATDSADFPTLRPLRQTSGLVVGEDSGPAGFLSRFQAGDGSLQLKSSSVFPGALQALAVDRRGRPHVTFVFDDLEIDGWEDLVGGCEYSQYLRIQASGRQLQNAQCPPIWNVTDLAVDRRGRVIIAGGSRLGVPLSDPVQATPHDREYGAGDLYVAVLAKGAVRPLFGTYLGGRRYESVGHPAGGVSGGLAISASGERIFLTGATLSRDYPLASPVQIEKAGGGRKYSAFVTELRPYE